MHEQLGKLSKQTQKDFSPNYPEGSDHSLHVAAN